MFHKKYKQKYKYFKVVYKFPKYIAFGGDFVYPNLVKIL